MNIIIEKAGLANTNLIIELIKALYLELGEESESIEFLNEEVVHELLINGKTDIFLARSETKEVVGILSLTESQSLYAGGYYGIVDELFILPAYRAHGVGSLMIQMIIAMGKARKWNRIELTGPTEVKWKRTMDFYNRSGFVFTGPKMKYLLNYS